MIVIARTPDGVRFKTLEASSPTEPDRPKGLPGYFFEHNNKVFLFLLYLPCKTKCCIYELQISK